MFFFHKNEKLFFVAYMCAAQKFVSLGGGVVHAQPDGQTETSHSVTP